MKVLLINPGVTNEEVYARYSAGAPCLPPLGLCYLAAVLVGEGHDVRILDCVAERTTTAQLRAAVEEFMPHLMGVTSTTVSYGAARKVLHTVKEIAPSTTTVLGGAHLSALPVATMSECEFVDIGVIGEGEYTLAEIVERLNRNGSFEDCKGAVVRENGRVVETGPRKPVKSLDDIPFPARDLLKDLRLYSHTPFRGAKFMTTMITSRGCPFNCGYCDQSVFGRSWRSHSADYVIAELSHLKQKYNIDFVSFEDDNFLLSKSRTLDICQMMIKASLNIDWSCLGRANEVDEDVLPLMKRAGCKTIYVGIESGSPRILELINKKMSLEDMRRGIDLIKKFGIKVTGSFILGVPTETREDLEKTIDLATSLPLDGISFFIFTPYPNTPLRDLAFQCGRVSDDWTNYSGHPKVLPFIPAGMDEEYLSKIQARAYRRFLLRPSYLLNHAGTFANRKALANGLRFLRALVST
jgi:radical SAM superfamily enzyme YgiQ (UPF0313 family)